MNAPRYIIGSGFHHNPERRSYEFFPTWLKNKLRMFNPEDILIVADSGAAMWPTSAHYQWIALRGDMGSCGALLNGSKKVAFNGWSCAMLSCALLAYTNETDLIWAEQDVLCFGDCVGEMYRQIGEGGVIHGDFRKSRELIMPAAQGLFLVRHWFIPTFIRQYLASGPQNTEARLGEHIFARCQAANPGTWKVFDFGYDRGRPLNFDDPVWYAQYWTAEELAELKRRGMI